MAPRYGPPRRKGRRTRSPPPESPSRPKRRRSRSPPPNMSPKLNLVLCGSDETLKASISDLLLGLSQRSPESRSKCARRDGAVPGRSINLMKMPALYNSPHSEEELRQEALHCVSLCDPGVNAFLLIIPAGPLTDADKGEMEKLQNIFSSKVKDHLIVLLTSQHKISKTKKRHMEQDTDLKNFLAVCNDRRILVEISRQTSKQLLDEIEKRREKQAYSLHMYMNAQEERVRCELQEKHKGELARKDKENQELKRKLQPEDDEDETQNSRCLRVVLIGKTGSGKSATGNTILGREEFESKPNLISVTRVCKKAVGEVQGKSVAVVDTPGLFETTLSHEEVQEEIVRCISLSAPGPHAFIIVLSLGGRITKEELDTLDKIKKIFGPKSAMFTIVLFTRGDDLGNQTIHQFIEENNMEQINKLLRDCGNRYLVFNNREKEDRSQVSELLRQIDTMVNSNRPSPYFTNSMFEEAETSIKKRIEEILKEKEREIQAEKTKYDKEMEEMMKRQEEEKQKADQEKLQMEKKFTGKIENLKKREDDERKQERQNLKKLLEKIEKDRQEEIKRREREDSARREREEKEREEMKRNYDRKMEEMMNIYKDEARQQAEQFSQDLIQEHQETLASLITENIKTVIKTREEMNKPQEGKRSSCAIL